MNRDHYRIGILGGMGPLAGVHLQKLIIQYTPAVIDQDHIQVLCFTNPHIPDRMWSLRENEGEVFSDAIVESLRVLEAGNVDCILIPCNTSHARFEKIQAATHVPVLNMVQLALRKVRASPTSFVGLLATEGTLTSRMFEFDNSFQWILPDFEHQKGVLQVIADIKAGRGEEADIVARIERAVDYLLEKGAEKVILGCTELSIYSEFIDSAKIIDPLIELAKEAILLAHAAESRTWSGINPQNDYYKKVINPVQNMDSVIHLNPEKMAVTVKKVRDAGLTPGIQPGRKIIVDGIEYERFPVRVPRLIEFGESMESLIGEYVKPHVQPGDWIAISEKMVSISQKLVRHISSVKVTWLARLVQKGVTKHKAMTAWNNPEKIQLAIEVAGWWRIIPAMVIGAAGRLVGQRGLFWVVAGHRVSEIDGFIPEDMYPYTEWAVLPPEDPQADCERFEKNIGIPCMTADANFINVEVLGISSGVGLDKRTVRLVLLDNPLGQGNKMTPFVIVRKIGSTNEPDTIVDNNTKLQFKR